MNYIGSKHKLSDFIYYSIKQTVGNTESSVFADIFGGTGMVSRRFKTEVQKIIANDTETYSYVLLRNYIGNTQGFAFENFMEELNETAVLKGFIYKQYCEGSGSGRQYFSDWNGQKIDAIRQKIDFWKKEKQITDHQYYFLLASLLESADKVANTASVYGAFLKKIKPSAQKSLLLSPALFQNSLQENEVYQQNANNLITKINGDILYLDPPYNARQYGANYHLLNTIAIYQPFEPSGKTGLPKYYRSQYCQKDKAAIELENLIKLAQFRYIFLSYNNEGIISREQIRQIFEKYGRYDLFSQTYQRFKADKTENRNHKADSTFEYLHVLEKW